VERAVADQAPTEPAEVGEDLVQVLVGQERLEQPDRRELDLVARPMVNAKPWPDSAGSGASVLITT